MFWDLQITPEEEDEIIRKAAEKIHKYGLETAAILFLESSKPLSFIGTQMGRFFISPILPAFGEDIGKGGEKLLHIFEKRENVEKLISVLEEMASGDKKKNKKKIESQLEVKPENSEQKPKKRGWRRFFPF